MRHKNIMLLLVVAFALLAYQNFSFTTKENLKSYGDTEIKPPLEAPHPVDSRVYDAREELERTATTLEKKLKTQAQWGQDQTLQVQLLDRTGLMQVHYSGITQVWFNYYVDRQDMNFEIKQHLTKNVQFSLDHHPKDQKSSVVMDVSW